MTRIELVKLYNRLSWYFCTGTYPTIKAKMEESCETLLKELDKKYEQSQKPKKSKLKDIDIEPEK